MPDKWINLFYPVADVTDVLIQMCRCKHPNLLYVCNCSYPDLFKCVDFTAIKLNVIDVHHCSYPDVAISGLVKISYVAKCKD